MLNVALKTVSGQPHSKTAEYNVPVVQCAVTSIYWRIIVDHHGTIMQPVGQDSNDQITLFGSLFFQAEKDESKFKCSINSPQCNTVTILGQY